MVKWIKDLFYKIFYKKAAKKTLLAMENCDAYQSYEKTLQTRKNNTLRVNNQMINDIERSIKWGIDDGRFKSIMNFDKYKLPKKNREQIKQYFLEKGYKVKIKNTKSIIIISWEHWDKI